MDVRTYLLDRITAGTVQECWLWKLSTGSHGYGQAFDGTTVVLANVENARDNGQLDKTHCPQGHPYSEENTYRTARGHRQCRACQPRWRTKATS
jgi:hypothetical protein